MQWMRYLVRERCGKNQLVEGMMEPAVSAWASREWAWRVLGRFRMFW